MTKLFAESKAISLITLILVVISSGLNQSIPPITVIASPTEPSSNGELLVIDVVNIEAKVNNRFVPLEELISEVVSPEFQEEPFPQLLNNSLLHINASYSTVVGRSESLAIHQFTLDIYSVISGEEHKLNLTETLSLYYDQNDPNLDIVEFVLGPNSSISEDVVVP